MGVRICMHCRTILGRLSNDEGREVTKPSYTEIADLLRRWEVADGNIGRFDRGLHLLGHLARGGTLEEYGEPDA